jgi:choline dehydrogenase-like flavoprotein
MATGKFDICVSGPGGGIAVFALAKAGLKVALVEAGLRRRAGIDYIAHGSPYSNLEQRVSKGLFSRRRKRELIHGSPRALRQQGTGKFIGAAYPGVYQFQETAPATRTGRAFGAPKSNRVRAVSQSSISSESRSQSTKCSSIGVQPKEPRCLRVGFT